MDKIYLNNEFDKFWTMIRTNQNFSLLRFGDGERALMMGKKVIAQEGWSAPEKITELGKSLLSCLSLENKNIYFGISCPCCDIEAYYWYKTRINSKNINTMK